MQDASSKIYANNATLESKISTATTNTSNQITLLQQNVNNQIKDVNSTLSSKKYVETTYKNGNSWYRVWSDGWIEQGGKASASATITFLKAFTAAPQAMITQTLDAAGPNNNPTVRTVSTTKMTTYSERDFFWYAYGY